MRSAGKDDLNRPTSDSESAVLNELCPELFASLSRSDQRRKGTAYLRGLLRTSGRKSIRNIAAHFDVRGAEQSLHHFICSSTWDWRPVRTALARFLLRTAPPQAWVVHPMVIPKAGKHSVGVTRRYSTHFGRELNAQQAVGVWAASEEVACPVDWWLHLPPDWLEDLHRRARASIPDDLRAVTVRDCVIEACRALATKHEAIGYKPTGYKITEHDAAERPVLLDTRHPEVAAAMPEVAGTGLPLLARIGGEQPLTVNDPALPSHNTEALPAGKVVAAAKNMRYPVMVPAPDGNGAHTRIAAAVRVRAPGLLADDAILLGVGGTRGRWPTELWLTDRVDASLNELVRLSALGRRIGQELHDTADRVGIRDFAGRSFAGWHRHITLASAAHAVLSLAESTRQDALLSRAS